MKAPFSTINAVIAISTGAIVLLGYFVPGFGFLRDIVLHWAIILAAFALLVGVMNLLSVHWKKITAGPKGIYSIVLILSFVATVALVSLGGPDGQWSQWLLHNVQIPVESTLVALLAVTLLTASMRLLRRRFETMTLIFIITAILVLVSSAPLYGLPEIPQLAVLRQWLTNVPAVAGARGLLLGVALGTIATGLRVLMGIDRPYSGQGG